MPSIFYNGVKSFFRRPPSTAAAKRLVVRFLII